MDSPPACTSARLFFPSKEPTVSTLTALSTYLGGFVARPFGAAIFGHFGDRVPTYAQIGIWGGIALTVLRILQGIGVGGEWGGAVLVVIGLHVRLGILETPVFARLLEERGIERVPWWRCGGSSGLRSSSA